MNPPQVLVAVPQTKGRSMFDNIDDIRKTRKKYNYEMFRSGVSIFREQEELSAKAMQEGALDQKTKELIALGISISEACYGCIEYHVGSAADKGASRQEIIEVAAVAMAMVGGSAQWPTRFLFKVLEDLAITA